MSERDVARPPLDARAWDETGTLYVAFSGGADSSCLLHRLLAAGLGERLYLLHVDHGLDPDSGARAVMAGRIAEAAGVRFDCIPLDPSTLATGLGTEAAARSARYAVLAERLQEGETVLTAHHADDRIETLLLQLLRGAGARGLSGMPLRRPLGKGWLGRPLLGWTRQELRDELDAAGIDWVHDGTNDATGPDRNYLRHAVLPRIQQRWTGYRSSMLRSIDRLSHAADAIDRQAERDTEALRRSGTEFTLDLERWLALPEPRAFEVLRAWAAPANPPPSDRMAEFHRQCRSSGRDRTPRIDGDGYVLHAWRGALWLDRDGEVPADWRVDLEPGKSRTLDRAGTFLWIRQGDEAFPDTVTVGALQPGDRIRLHPGGPQRRAAELLREAGVPPWRRHRVPAVHRHRQLVALGTRWIDPVWRQSNALEWADPPPELLPYVFSDPLQDARR